MIITQIEYIYPPCGGGFKVEGAFVILALLMSMNVIEVLHSYVWFETRQTATLRRCRHIRSGVIFKRISTSELLSSSISS